MPIHTCKVNTNITKKCIYNIYIKLFVIDNGGAIETFYLFSNEKQTTNCHLKKKSQREHSRNVCLCWGLQYLNFPGANVIVLVCLVCLNKVYIRTGISTTVDGTCFCGENLGGG